MVKYDPKLVKKINQSELLAAAKEAGIKNFDKVSKEQLIPAFLETVEKMNDAGGDGLTPSMVETYNKIVTILGLDQEPPAAEEAVTEASETEAASEDIPDTGEETPPAEAPAAAAAPAPKPTPKPAPGLKPKPTPTPVAKPAAAAAPAPKAPIAAPAAAPTPKAAPTAKASPAPKAEKPKAEPKPKTERYTRITALCDTFHEMNREGKLDDLYIRSNQKYYEHGGTDKITESTFFGKNTLVVLQSLGFAEVTEDSFKIVGGK